MDPIAFHLGPIAVHWYGILIAAAFLIGVWGSLREAKRQGIDEDHFLNLVIAVIIYLAAFALLMRGVIAKAVSGRKEKGGAAK